MHIFQFLFLFYFYAKSEGYIFLVFIFRLGLVKVRLGLPRRVKKVFRIEPHRVTAPRRVRKEVLIDRAPKV